MGSMSIPSVALPATHEETAMTSNAMPCPNNDGEHGAWINPARFLALFLFVSMLLITSICHANSKQITIGLFPFPENIAVTHVWQQLLEKKGFTVKIRNASRPIVFAGVAGGSMDLALELWLPYTDKARYESIKNKVTLTTPWYDKAWQGLAVP